MNDTPTSPSSFPEHRGRVLVLAPDGNLAGAIRAALHEAAPNAQVDIAHSLEEAQHVVISQQPDLFVLDVDATYDLGQEFLYDLRTSHPHARAIVLTAVHLAAHREMAAGLGAIHFLEKPFPHGDFVLLAEALLQPHDQGEGEKFQGTLSDLHMADIIQLKCMSGATSVLEFSGPSGEKARVFFEEGQVRHATAPGKEGIEAFNEIVNWKGGKISEIPDAPQSAGTIDLDWQILLMEAVRKMDESHGAKPDGVEPVADAAPARRKVLVIDDSVMLLKFVKEILSEANYDVAAAATAIEGLEAAAAVPPDLILLDYVLPDMKGDGVLGCLMGDPATVGIPVVYMSGFGADLPSDPRGSSNVIGSLNKPFTSELLLSTVEKYMPKETSELEITASESAPEEIGWAAGAARDWNVDTAPLRGDAAAAEPESGEAAESTVIEAAAGGGNDAWWTAPANPAPWAERESATEVSAPEFEPSEELPVAAAATAMDVPAENSAAYFCGDTSFFSLNWALHTIAAQKLTGTLRCFWDRDPVELLARDGQLVLATTRDPKLYCPETPITLVNLDHFRTNAARQQQRETGQPVFITLAQEDLILREPAAQLVRHYGQKLFSQLWTGQRVRFMFEQSEQLPDYSKEIPAEGDVDQWTLATLRFIQSSELGKHADYDQASIPAYTRDGFERVQGLRLTVAEAQFASQFNGVRSIAQIAKNLRLDLRFARLALFRFLALEIVECWPPATAGKPEKRGIFGRVFGD